MKKLILFLMLVGFTGLCFSQQTAQTNQFIQGDYLQKSQHQKTAAWILLGGGIALAITGVAVDASNWQSSAGDVLIVAGAVSVLASMPLFIAAGKNKKKAMSLSTQLEIQKLPLGEIFFAKYSYPAIAVKFDF